MCNLYVDLFWQFQLNNRFPLGASVTVLECNYMARTKKMITFKFPLNYRTICNVLGHKDEAELDTRVKLTQSYK